MTDKLYIPPALQIISENIAKWGNPLGMANPQDVELVRNEPTITFTYAP